MRLRARRGPSILTRLPSPPAIGACIALALMAAATPGLAQQLAMDPHICRPGEREFTVALAIGTGGRLVVGLEVEISFDPGIVELLGVDAGSWITGSGREYFFYDHTVPGATTIHLTMAFLGGGVDGTGQLALCRFNALAEGTCPLGFVHLDVRDATNLDLEFSSSTGDVIIIEPAVEVEGATWGGVKAQFR